MNPGLVAPRPAVADAAAMRPGSITLIARDQDLHARFYEEMIGLHRMETERDAVYLRDGRAVLVVSRQRDVVPDPSGFAGLFHVPFLLPTRRNLVSWLRRALRSGMPLERASDHGISEALYLVDPKGNGIEIYADRSPGTWR